MKRSFFLIILCFVPLFGMTGDEFYAWTSEWMNVPLTEREPIDSVQYYNLPGNYLATKKSVPVPVVEQNRESAYQLEKLVGDAMMHGQSLVWALDSLNPTAGPAANLTDSVRRQILYYLFVERLAAFKKPWEVSGMADGSLHIYDGTGTSQVGWIRFAYFSPACDGRVFSGFFTFAWSPTQDTIASPTRSMKMLNDAMIDGVLFGPPDICYPTEVPSSYTIEKIMLDSIFSRQATSITTELEYDRSEYDSLRLRKIYCTVQDGFEYLLDFPYDPDSPYPEYRVVFKNLLSGAR